MSHEIHFTLKALLELLNKAFLLIENLEYIFLENCLYLKINYEQKNICHR